MSPAIIPIIADKDNMKFLRDTANRGISTGEKVMKWTGITLAVALGGYLLYKAGAWAVDKWKLNSDLHKATDGLDKSKATLDETSAKSLADRLYNTGFDQSAWIAFYADYKETVIKQILQELQNIHDWKLLYSKFGLRTVKVEGEEKERGKEHDLIWFLGRDDPDDVAEYQKILNEKGINVKI